MLNIIVSFITILSFSKTVHRCILHSTQLTAAVQNSQLFDFVLDCSTYSLELSVAINQIR